MNKLLIITGPTATGKTALAIELAKKFNGEIISADSRQVYKHMDIGTGKDRGEYIKNNIKIWGIDLVDPDYNFNVSDYVEYAAAAISDIQNRNKLPIIVGGTALYIKALLEPFETVNIPPDQKLRNKLSKYSVENLQKELIKLDNDKWKKMNISDRNNPRRLIRAIEVAESCGKYTGTKHIYKYTDNLILYLTAANDYLYKRIDRRVDDRMKQGAIAEVQNLQKMGYSFDLPSLSASGYKEFRQYFLAPSSPRFAIEAGPLPLAPCIQKWKFNEHAYARRQVSFISKFAQRQAQKGVKTYQVNIEQPDWKQEVLHQAQTWYSEV